MKKVQIITLNLGCGGAEKVLIDILNKLDYSKYNVELLLIEKKGIYISQVNENVKIKSIFSGFTFKNSRLNCIHEFIKRNIIKYFGKFILPIHNKADIQIAFLEGLTTLLVSKSKKNVKKRIAWIHTDLSKLRAMSFEKELHMYRKFDKIVCVSEEALEKTIQLYPTIGEKCKVIYNLIDSKEIIKKSQVEITHDFKFKSPVIIAVGRLYSAKRFDILIEAHAKLINNGIDNILVILGEGQEEENLRNLITRLHVSDTVKLLGFKTNPYKYIKKADIFVVSSDYEGFSLVTAEALVLGKAIISTKCVGPIELLQNGECGLLVECGDVEGLSNNIKMLISDKRLKSQIEEKARNRGENFESENIINEIHKLIDEEVIL